MPIHSKVNDWGGNSISISLFHYLEKTLPEGKTILELGSGWGTGKLAEKWNIWSVEDDAAWAGKYNDQYFAVPLSGLWYNTGILEIYLRGLEYDLLLIDGPYDHREGFLEHLSLFKQDVPMVFDDVRRKSGRRILEQVSVKLDRPWVLHGLGREMFGIIE